MVGQIKKIVFGGKEFDVKPIPAPPEKTEIVVRISEYFKTCSPEEKTDCEKIIGEMSKNFGIPAEKLDIVMIKGNTDSIFISLYLNPHVKKVLLDEGKIK